MTSYVAWISLKWMVLKVCSFLRKKRKTPHFSVRKMSVQWKAKDCILLDMYVHYYIDNNPEIYFFPFKHYRPGWFIYLLHEHSSPPAFLAFHLNLLLFWPRSMFPGESQPSKGYKHPWCYSHWSCGELAAPSFGVPGGFIYSVWGWSTNTQPWPFFPCSILLPQPSLSSANKL